MKKIIQEILQELVPGVDVTSNALVDTGCIQSLAMIQLVAELDIAFNIEITFESIVRENFNSVDAMVRMVESYLK